MNKVELIGRLTRDPDVRYSQTQTRETMCIARYTLAVDRRGKDAGADFISCVAFGKNGEFAEKYLKQGMKMGICGRIQTGSYTTKEGQRVYTTDVVVEEQEFAESKSNASERPREASESMPQSSPNDGFMKIPEGLENDLPFK